MKKKPQAPCHQCSKPVTLLCSCCLHAERASSERWLKVRDLTRIGYTQSEIAKKLRVSRQSVSQTLARLREEGML